ncbi:sensor histidine kinase [Streptomyces sp. PvR034]|uniref:sensor histidine kinase n=1 Tax=Streptomyces sp. PvR034 TaxID=3156401 RepID=UPI003395410F
MESARTTRRSRPSRPVRAAAGAPPAATGRALTPVSRVLRLCLHALLFGLLALAAGRAVTDSAPGAGWVVAACALLAVVYVAGVRAPVVHRSPGAGALWLAGLGAAWAGLLVVSPDGLWIAFPLYFLELHLLRLRWGVTAVALTACAAIAGFLGHSSTVSPGAFLGPLLGGAVAVATVLGYQALYRESERRRELIEELITTRAELAAAERGAGILAERERLAREIHDTLAQGLSSIQLLLRAAERSLGEGPPPAGPAEDGGREAGRDAGGEGDGRAAALGHIARAREAAQDNLAEARRFVRALSPPDLEHGSLAAALERLCVGAPGVRARFSLSGSPAELPTPYEVALLRIAQSALANVVRHAGAGRAEITLTFMDASVTLDIVDDGRGFDPAAGRSGDGDRGAGADGGGFGLPAMRSRAETLGGTFTVESAPGQGTAVAVTLPLPVEAPR